LTAATLEGQIWWQRSCTPCYHGSETCRFAEPSKNHLAGWFFRLQGKRLRAKKKDLKKILL
ncbi:hypothetical protein ACVSRT_28695, partial [Klebsiella pneumoniae]